MAHQDSYTNRVREVRRQNADLLADQALASATRRDGTSSCCGAEEVFDADASSELTWRYRCGQCGLLQDR